jgi:hypothetical protein
LRHHGISRVSDEGFDFQILLYPTEKDLDLPALFVNIRYCFGREFEVVGDENIVFASFGILVANPSEQMRALTAFGSG